MHLQFVELAARMRPTSDLGYTELKAGFIATVVITGQVSLSSFKEQARGFTRARRLEVVLYTFDISPLDYSVSP